MQDFFFYIKLGLQHVLDFNAYDHMLFLLALTLPFTFKDWKKVVLLATIFTIAHCFSLFLSVYEVLAMDVSWVEFLIPVTILLTSLFSFIYVKSKVVDKNRLLHIATTAFFGLIHGFGFSNYFKMLMSEEENKFSPLFGFATGIEISQVFIVLCMLLITYLFTSILKIKQALFTAIVSLLIIIITIPMLITAFP